MTPNDFWSIRPLHLAAWTRCFGPIINHFTQIAEDMSETKRLLVHTANTFVPVSVIIVGVGRANKEKMKILDGDNRTLTSNEGVRAKRDIVQFVGESKNIYFLFFFQIFRHGANTKINHRDFQISG